MDYPELEGTKDGFEEDDFEYSEEYNEDAMDGFCLCHDSPVCPDDGFLDPVEW